jgi:hypothetical protein
MAETIAITDAAIRYPVGTVAILGRPAHTIRSPKSESLAKLRASLETQFLPRTGALPVLVQPAFRIENLSAYSVRCVEGSISSNGIPKRTSADRPLRIWSSSPPISADRGKTVPAMSDESLQISLNALGGAPSSSG